jgi:hypothetical protein
MPVKQGSLNRKILMSPGFQTVLENINEWSRTENGREIEMCSLSGLPKSIHPMELQPKSGLGLFY